ncbi:MAG: fructose-6-phosphate aldolase [Gammaproteobacteria bacterium]|nr:fructose-6-phosphate aldolase [Gammaproteobacteria bacterium]|tara:strand:- start:653 stop:1300 length:648 start_codon:yes stop_codon:yes gene_type:complete
MQIFLDTADFSAIEERYDSGLIAGVTTNPTLVANQGINYLELIKNIAETFPEMESISAEVNGNTAWEFIEDAAKFRDISEAVTIKLPMTKEGLKACKYFSDVGVKTNVTLCFSVAQAALAGIAGATYISPFVGRLNDNSFSGVELVRGIADLYCNQGIQTKVLAASLRDVHHVSRCFLYGAKVCTLPLKVFDKMYDHVLTREGLDIFDKDFKRMV